MNSPTGPMSRDAAIALAVASIAVVLAILGAFSPWGALRFPLERKLTGVSAVLAYGGTCVLPIALGLCAALLGGRAFKTIEQSQGKFSGDGPAFFSLLIGLFATVIGVCTTFAALIWPMI